MSRQIEFVAFPSHNIDPKRKGREWILQGGKAIWSFLNKNESGMLYDNLEEYERIETYVQGNQDTSEYKKLLLGADCEDEESVLAINWKIRPLIPKMRDIAISKVLNRQYRYGCYPIDPMAKDEAEKYYTDIKAKVMQKEAMLAAAPELASNPAFLAEAGEPEDMEELEMSMNNGPKIKRAMDAEMMAMLIMYKNKYERIRKVNVGRLIDFGIAGVQDYVDENSDPIIDDINVKLAFVSPCEKDDFSDKSWAGLVKEVPISLLAGKFNDDELELIKNQAINKRDAPSVTSTYNKNYDPFKVYVLDFEIKSYNSTTYEYSVKKGNNLMVYKTDYTDNKEHSGKKIMYNGEEIPKFKTNKREVVYKGRWVIGTDLIYDYGLAEETKYNKKSKAVCNIGFNFQAVNYYQQKPTSFISRAIPIADEWQMTNYKIQQFKNKWLPYIVDVDLDGLESIPFGKAGKMLKQKEVLAMVYKNFTLVTRRGEFNRNNPNYKSIDVRPTGMAQEYQVLVNDLVRLINEIRDVLGLNEITDGSSPNPNMLNYVASLGNEATNNALKPIMDADKALGEQVARACIERGLSVVRKKKIEGLMPALGRETLQFFSFGPEMPLHDYGIMVIDLPTEQEKQMLIQTLNLKDANGQINPEDYFIISQMTNMKQAGQLLALRRRKREEALRQYELQKMQMNGQVQTTSAQAAEKAKQETIELEARLKRDLEMDLKLLDKEMLILKLEAEKEKEAGRSATKLTETGMKLSNSKEGNDKK